MLLLPQLEMATAQQVADFYEVDVEAIKSIVRRNGDELETDGMVTFKRKDVKNLNRQGDGIEITPYVAIIRDGNGNEYKFTNRGIKVFPKRAILRVGMLLRDSEVAKEVRTQLLNIEEKATAAMKSAEIDIELSIIKNEISDAVISGDFMKVLEATTKLNEYNNRQIKKVESKLKESETTVKLLANEFKTLDKKALLKKLVNTVAFTMNKPQSKIWVFLYSELMYKTGAIVKNRTKVNGSYLNTLSENELDVCISSITLLAKKRGISLSKEVELI